MFLLVFWLLQFWAFRFEVFRFLAFIAYYGALVFIFFFLEHSFWGVIPSGSAFVFPHLEMFREMKASSSSSDSSSEESSTLRAFDELLEACSLNDETFLSFWLLRARDFFLFGPSSYWSSCSWTLRVPTSSSRDIKSRFFRSFSVVAYNLHFLDKLLKMLSIWS